MRKDILNVVIAGTGGVIVGGVIGYVVTNHIVRKKYEAIAQEEIESVKKYYRDRDVSTVQTNDLPEPWMVTDMDGMDTDENGVPYFSPQEMTPNDVEALREEFEALQNQHAYSHPEVRIDYNDPANYSSIGGKVQAGKMTIEEAEEIETDSTAYRELLANRDENEPYVITIDEFMTDNLPGYDNQTLTYFQSDDTLIDEREKIIPEVEATVGSESLTRFGYFSKDQNIVYVRNDRTKMQFEIVLDERSYVEAIAGFAPPKEPIRKMREDD